MKYFGEEVTMLTNLSSSSSFPHGNFILLPFLVVTVASVMSFGSLASCDLVKTEWAIDCSSSQNTSNCVYIATMKMGLIGKMNALIPV